MKTFEQFITEGWKATNLHYFLGEPLEGKAYRHTNTDVFTIAKKDGKWRIEDFNGEEVENGFSSLAKAKKAVEERM